MDINIGLDETERKGAVQILSKLLADEYVLLVKTKNYHWNVRGQHFYSLHKFFDEQYQELAEITDEVAERIRKLGEMSPATLSEFLQMTRLSETLASYPNDQTMIRNLLEDHEAIIRHLRVDLKTCNETYHDMGTNDFLTGLMEKHEKIAWMLRASLEE